MLVIRSTKPNGQPREQQAFGAIGTFIKQKGGSVLSEVKKQLTEWDVVKIVLAVNGALAGIVAAVASLIT